jgi:hypothetical protein
MRGTARLPRHETINRIKDLAERSLTRLLVKGKGLRSRTEQTYHRPYRE